MENLVAYSLVAVYSAMGVYTVAFILFTLDLARRSAVRAEEAAAQELQASVTVSAVGVAPSGGSGSTTVLDRADAPPHSSAGTRYQRAAFALAILGFALHLAAVLTRGIAAERVPWANMFEFGLTATAVGMGTFLVV